MINLIVFIIALFIIYYYSAEFVNEAPRWMQELLAIAFWVIIIFSIIAMSIK